MFDQLIATILITAGLTRNELSELARKLSHAGDSFFEQAHAIAETAFDLQRNGRITTSSDAWNGLWHLREPHIDAMYEMHDLMTGTDEALGYLLDIEDCCHAASA